MSEGSPISPAFATAEKLAAWMSSPERGDYHWVAYDVAMRFIEEGWAPTFVTTAGGELVSGVNHVGRSKTWPQ